MRDSRLTAGQRQQQHFQFPARTHWYTQTLCGNILLLNKIKFKLKKKDFTVKKQVLMWNQTPTSLWICMTASFELDCSFLPLKWRQIYLFLCCQFHQMPQKTFEMWTIKKLQVKVDCYSPRTAATNKCTLWSIHLFHQLQSRINDRAGSSGIGKKKLIYFASSC